MPVPPASEIRPECSHTGSLESSPTRKMSSSYSFSQLCDLSDPGPNLGNVCLSHLSASAARMNLQLLLRYDTFRKLFWIALYFYCTECNSGVCMCALVTCTYGQGLLVTPAGPALAFPLSHATSSLWKFPHFLCPRYSSSCCIYHPGDTVAQAHVCHTHLPAYMCPHTSACTHTHTLCTCVNAHTHKAL